MAPRNPSSAASAWFGNFLRAQFHAGLWIIAYDLASVWSYIYTVAPGNV